MMILWKIGLLLLMLLWMMRRMLLSTLPTPVVFDSPPYAILAIHPPMQIWIVCMPLFPNAIVVIQICCCPSHRQRGVLFHGIDWWCNEYWSCCWLGDCCYCWNRCQMVMVTADLDCCCYCCCCCCCWNHRRRRKGKMFVVTA